MLTIILIKGLVEAIITGVFILIRKNFLKKNIIAFDINMVILMINGFSEMYFNVKNDSNGYEFLAKSIVQFLFFMLYIYISMRLFRKATLLKGTENNKEEKDK